MAVCKFCNCDTLEWKKDSDTGRFYLTDENGNPHKCLNQPGSVGSRLSPVYRMLDALSGRELLAVINYGARLLADRADPKADRVKAAAALAPKAGDAAPAPVHNPDPVTTDSEDLPVDDAQLPF